MLGIYILLDNLLSFLMGAKSNVAFGAHIGGFFAGLAVAWVGEHFAWRWPWTDSFWRLGSAKAKQPIAEEPVSRSPLLDIRNALAHNDPDQAIEALAKIDRGEVAQLGPNECIVLANWLEDVGHPIAATRLLRSCLANHQGVDNLADVYLMLGLMRLRQKQPTAAYQYLLSVFDYDPSPETAARAREALNQIDMYRR